MEKAFEMLRNIKSVVISTNGGDRPHSRIVDIMHYDEGGIYFVTLVTKPFYRQLAKNNKVAVTAMNKDYVQVRIEGMAEKIDSDFMDEVRRRNPEFVDLFPKLDDGWEAFYIMKGKGEIFDLSGKDVKMKRERFGFGGETVRDAGCIITKECIECGSCKDECPFSAIEEGTPYKINNKHCDECGICYRICPVKAIELPTGM